MRSAVNERESTRPIWLAGTMAVAMFLLAAYPWEASAQAPAAPAKSPVVGTWKSKDLCYTFNEKGEYLALFGEMDHQGTYRIEGKKIVITPKVVAQRPAAQWLKELTKEPDRLLTEDRTLGRQLAKPYALRWGTDGKTLVGLGFKLKLDPLAKPLF